MQTILDTLYSLCNGIEYNRNVPKEAKELAAANNCVIIVGGSDDLMYAYGAQSYLTDYCEHGYGWDGDTLIDISDKKLEQEAAQLGLKIFWCGKILDRGENILESIPDYDTEKMGAFSYTVKEGITFRNFTVLENIGKPDVYCTGIIIQLPENFVPSNTND